MAALRCWPGCLAYITDDHPIVREANVGRLVRVVRRDQDFGSLARWMVEAVGAPLHILWTGTQSTSTGTWGYHPDAWLRPITPRPPPPSAETETVEQILEEARGEKVWV